MADHRSLGSQPGRRPFGQFVPGDRVGIRRGLLAGATGVIVSFTAGQRCTLRLDGLPDGALVATNPAAFQLIEAAGQAPQSKLG